MVPSAIKAHLALTEVVLVPEVRLYQAAEPIGLWEATEGEYHSDQPPPFWAFAWAGGTALARYILDHPELVAGREVLDLAAGSGLVAIAAARAGAAAVRAVEVDPTAADAIALNATANEVTVSVTLADILDEPVATGVIFAGDVFYSSVMARRVLGFLQRSHHRGSEVVVGDPGRAYFNPQRFEPLAVYDIPVTQELESADAKRTTVWRLV